MRRGLEETGWAAWPRIETGLCCGHADRGGGASRCAQKLQTEQSGRDSKAAVERMSFDDGTNSEFCLKGKVNLNF